MFEFEGRMKGSSNGTARNGKGGRGAKGGKGSKSAARGRGTRRRA